MTAVPKPSAGAARDAPGGAAAALLAALLTGCAAVGPDYSGPPPVARAAVAADGFHRAAAAEVTSPAPPPARWWDAVGDPTLTRLIDEAFAASPTLAAAVARVRSARAQQAQNRAALGPTGSVGGRYIRGSIPTGSFGGGASSGDGGGGSGSSIPDPLEIDSYSVSTNATWEIDIFGGKRRGIEGATATAQARQAALEDAQVTLASDVAEAYARLREAQSRLALGSRGIRLRSDTLALTRHRRAAGTAADGDVERAQADLAQARAELPALQTAIEQQLDQLAILAGRPPGAYDALLAVPADAPVALPRPPASVPVGQPADWLRRRPDIRQAERTLAASNAAIGSNVAALFPTVSVLGFLGTTGANVGDLFKGSALWLLTPSLTWNFLSIPTNRAKVRGAEADRDANLADYQRTVLAALQDANASLSRFGRQRQALAEREAARDAAARGARIVRERYAAGSASLIDALDSERQRVQADDQAVQAGASVMVAYVGLNKSLGLGWGAAPPEDGATARAGDAVPPPASADPRAAAPSPTAAVPDAAAGAAVPPAGAAPAPGSAAVAGAAADAQSAGDAAPVIDAGEGLSNAPGPNPASRPGSGGSRSSEAASAGSGSGVGGTGAASGNGSISRAAGGSSSGNASGASGLSNGRQAATPARSNDAGAGSRSGSRSGAGTGTSTSTGSGSGSSSSSGSGATSGGSR